MCNNAAGNNNATKQQDQDEKGLLQADPDVPACEMNNCNFSYPNPYGEKIPAIRNMSFKIPQGSRVLLIAQNGGGKSTMLRLLSGKHLVGEDEVKVFGKPAFFQTLGVSGVSYLGGEWVKAVAFAGNVSYSADIKACKMRRDLQDKYPERRDELYRILEIDPEWRMHQVSDGQRRRVQIMLGLLQPFKLLLLDEVTVDLSVTARTDFLAYLEKESRERGATIIYATHIFDQMGNWPTHLLKMDLGKCYGVEEFDQICSQPGYSTLSNYVLEFLLERREINNREKEQRKKEKAEAEKDMVKDYGHDNVPLERGGGWIAGRMSQHMAYK